MTLNRLRDAAFDAAVRSDVPTPRLHPSGS